MEIYGNNNEELKYQKTFFTLVPLTLLTKCTDYWTTFEILKYLYYNILFFQFFPLFFHM